MFYPILASLSNSDNISFDFDSGSGYSTLTPSSCTPPHTLNYMPFHFSPDASTWLNPAPINVATSRRRDTLPTAGPGEHSITFSDPWRGKAGAEDGYEPWWERPSVGAPANSVDAVSAAFLQLIEAHGWDANIEAVSFLRRLLFDSCLRQEELLDLVDWRRLLKLAANASHVLRYAGRGAAWLMPSTTNSRHLKFDHSPNSLATNATTTLSDLEEVYHSAEFLPLADTTPGTPINDYELRGMQPLSFPSNFSDDPAGPAFPSGAIPTASTIPSTPSTISPTLLIPPPPILLHPSSPELDPEPPIEPAELHQPAPDAAIAPKRRCLDCQAEHTKQWRTHPELPGYLCNACGQHQAKHKSPRSNLAIRRKRTRASDKYAATVPTRPSSPPEKR
ncbi:hypothetical protein B0H11DRAFT_2279794, partial [Mycena galericulata]